MNLDLFGTEVAQPKMSLSAVFREKFSESEIDYAVESLPHAMMEALNDALRAYVSWRAIGLPKPVSSDLLGAENELSPQTRLLIENLMWVYCLYDKPAGITFETVCATLGEDVENLRNILSRQFHLELNSFIGWVSKHVDAAYAGRIAKRLDGYVTIHASYLVH